MARLIEARHDLSPTELDRLELELYRHNRSATGADDGRGLGYVAHDAGAMVGTIAGYSWAGMAEIRQLWVGAAHRGQGLGQDLLERFLAEAQLRGCGHVWVTTHDFQAPGLYERCGFERAAELADWPPGHAKIILHRTLITAPPPACQPAPGLLA